MRVRDGEVLLTDGPFADTKEQIGGLVLIECADLDEAVEIASRHPAAGWISTTRTCSGITRSSTGELPLTRAVRLRQPER